MTRAAERTALFGPFLLDLRTGELSRKGRKVPLQPQPFQLLQLLLEKSGKLVTFEEIRGALWPEAPFVDFEHGVGTAIKKLRDALGDNALRPYYIETLRKRGYRFIAPVAYHTQNGHDDGRKRTIVGRDTLLRELRESLGHAAARERQVVFLSGEAGIGKTALVDQFVRQATAEDSTVQVVRGQCVEGYGGKEAFYPILEAVAELCRAPGGAAYVELLTDHAPTLLVQVPLVLKRGDRERLLRDTANATRERMLREIRQALEAIASNRTLIVVLEDLQWVDPSTLDLIAALARFRAPAKLMLVGTFRPLDVALADHPLKGLKQELVVHRLGREFPLVRLSEQEVAEYLVAQAPGAVLPQGFASVVHRHSGGNPLFMITALEHVLSRGLVVRDGNGWQLAAPLDEVLRDVPENLREMIEAQIGRLSANEQRALEAASIVGVAFSIEACATAAAEVGVEGLEEICERLSRRQHIVRVAEAQLSSLSGSARYEFVHALYRQVLYERQPRGRRVSLHQRVAEQIEQLSQDRLSDVASELAAHFEEASDWSRAVYYYRLASYAAESRRAHAEASALLEHALVSVQKLPDDERAVHEIAILEKLALLYVSTADLRAIPTYEALCARAAHYGYLEVEVRGLTSMAFPLSWVSAERCRAVLERALLLSAGLRDPTLRATTRASAFALRLSVGDWNPADAEAFRAALEEIRASDDHVLIAAHHVDLSAIQISESSYRMAHHYAVESISTLEAHERNIFLDPAAWRAQVYAVWSLLFLGEWGEAWREIATGMAIAEKNHDPNRLESVRLQLAWLHLMALDYAGAVSIARSVLESQTDPTRVVPRRVAKVLAGAAEAGLGHENEALALLLETRHEMDKQAVIRDHHWRMMLESSLADMWLAKDDLRQARVHADAFVAASLKTADRTWKALGLELMARIDIVSNDLARAQENLQKAFATMEDHEVPLAGWRVHATAAELRERQGRYEQAEEHRERSAEVIRALANSLAGCEPLQRVFVAAPAVRRILRADPAS